MNPQEFDVSDWLARSANGGPALSEGALSAIAAFTTMWNIFESNLCNNSASLRAFESLAGRYSPASAPNAAKAVLTACLEFWRKRYRSDDGFASRFDALHFRSDKERERVQSVLSAQNADSQATLLALVLIVYRLRNNLFHGLKDVATLNEQVANLTTASHCLAAVLEALPSSFYAMRERPAIA